VPASSIAHIPATARPCFRTVLLNTLNSPVNEFPAG
jgi:hypothetical protein